ncbi:hypothetical protein [Hypericibacter sp.]|uniref:hypothetical protein n=1 Tax=Hypericibacter sp. TaxID=2705401 RepID=UPI003D6D27DA
MAGLNATLRRVSRMGLFLDAKKITIVRSAAKPVWTESSIHSSRSDRIHEEAPRHRRRGRDERNRNRSTNPEAARLPPPMGIECLCDGEAGANPEEDDSQELHGPRQPLLGRAAIMGERRAGKQGSP